MKGVAILVLVVLAVVQLSTVARGAVTCGQVDANLAPCVSYLTQGGEPSAACCTGVKTINGNAQSPDDRKTACNCIKAAANRYSNIKDDAAKSLPSKCGISLNVPISKTVNCDTLS